MALGRRAAGDVVVRHPELLARVGALYYLHGRTQEEIAETVGVSRPTVSRALRAARAAGIVDIRVSHPRGAFLELESELEDRFGLRDARVVPSGPGGGAACCRAIGAAAGDDLARTIRDGQRVGIGSGALLAAMVDAVRAMATANVRVIPAVGWGHELSTCADATELARCLARRIGADAAALTVPAVVASEDVRRELASDPHVAAALRALDALDTLYVEIEPALGTGSDSAPIGRIALCAFDRCGAAVRTGLEQRVLGITAGQLAGARHVVGLARGPEGAAAIAAALRAHVVGTLIVDEPTARALATLRAR